MIVSRKYEIGQVVEVSMSRDDIYNAMPLRWEVPQGWRGKIIKEGVTADGLYYAYDLQGEDGTILENYPSPCLLPVASGSDRSISKIIGNMILGTDDDIERAELEIALNFILDRWGDMECKKSLMRIAYQYGKTVGIREERQRKKSLKTTLAR